jgi:hypothetical protein
MVVGMDGERAAWSMRIDEADDVATLDRIDVELRGATAVWAGALRFKIGQKKAKAKKAAVTHVATSSVFAAGYGLPVSDKRWLYRYRLTDAAFNKLQKDLGERRDVAALESGSWPGLFVLWAAEWFRRCYRGGGHRWVDLTGALGMVEDQTRLRQITVKGLKAWGRPVLTARTAREFLGSLAREGGFPAAAIADGGRGWAQDVLKAIVAPLLGEPVAGEDRARELASAQRTRLPQLFQDDEFIALCADLALAIVELRRDADVPAAHAGLPTVAWLGVHRPDWRERLPLITGDRAAEALLAGLMTVEAVSGAGVGVERLLVCEADGWHEAVRLTLDGGVDSAAMRAINPAEGRLRAFAGGEMARILPGELAMLDPPAVGGRTWTARATRRARGVQRLPFATPIELDLRAGEQRVARIGLPAGKPRRGAVLVGVLEAGTDTAPSTLRITGSGSGQYAAEIVYLQVPESWTVTATSGETVLSLGHGVGATHLWRVTGGAYVTDDAGDCFRIRCGQAGDQSSRIELIGTTPAWAEVTGDADLFVGSPLVRLGRGEGSLYLRAIGERRWQPAPHVLPVGQYEIGWRSERILLDRRRIAVLPATAELVGGGSPQNPSYTLAGWGDCSLVPGSDAPVEPVEAGARWRTRRTGQAPVHWFSASVRWPGQPELVVRINHPCAATLARWDGQVLPNRARLTLPDLRDLVAIGRGRVQLMGELVDRGVRRTAEMRWDVMDELPMSSIAGDIASLLLPASIDAEVRLGMHDGSETFWHVRQFAVELLKGPGGIVASRGIVVDGAELVGRAIADPTSEISFGVYSLLSDANHRPVPLPEALAGDWLVYLRAGDTVLSRPLFHRGTIAAQLPAGAIARAMTNPPGHLLDAALLDVLQQVVIHDPEADAIVVDLLALVASLRGLPPATFRVLELLVRRPGLLTKLAIAASPDQREAVMALSDALPFAWCTIPSHWWQEAQGSAFDANCALLAPLGSDAPRYAKEALDTITTALIECEPLLGPLLLPNPTESMTAITQAFMNRAAERVPPSSGRRYRSHLPTQLPAYFERFHEGYLDTLDAPYAAALAVAEMWTPQPDDLRHIKTVARTFPTYFADAFAASLKELR